MDGQHSKRALPNTPRINDSIIEYCQKFGENRDLEKFMRIYSPCASSQDSQRTQHSSNKGFGVCCARTRSRETVSSTSSCEALVKMPSHPFTSGCCGINSKSMPNIDVLSTIAAKDLIMDINIEVEGDNGKIFSASTECIQTPRKDPLSEVKQTQTPESVAKSHRRLEWDSLGDIGYKKSMSTSNISVLERSVLKEFFKEKSVNSEPSSSVNEEKNSVRNQPQVREQHKSVETTKATFTEHATPPLASSTLVEVGSAKPISRGGARPKMISQSTSSTSLQKKFEKYAQTSLLKPPSTHSQEIQVSMSSSTSVIDESVTPSSFEFHSSRSSRSSKSSEYKGVIFSNKRIPTEQHPFINSITELLAKKKYLSEHNHTQRLQNGNIQQLQSRFQTALEENKENQSHSHNTISSTSTSFSLTRQAPELDLGIQLICSLIDAKSVNGKQKKKLIRDIVKRITRLNDENTPLADTNKSNGNRGSQSTASSAKPNVYDSVNSSRRSPLEKREASDLGVTPINTGASKYHEKENSENNGCSRNLNTRNEQTNVVYANKTHSKAKPHPSTKSDPKKVLSNKQISHPQLMATKENRIGTLNLTDIKSSPQKRNKETSSELVNMQKRTSRDSLQETDNHLLKTRSTQTSKSFISTESKKLRISSTSRSASSGGTTTTTTTSTSSHDLPTQKSLRKPLGNSNADAGDQPTMREWLNPLTQSEIEYEEKKRREECESERKHREKVLKSDGSKKKAKNDGERMQQLSWIEGEIQRLECLKHLLIKDNNNSEKSTTATSTTYRSSDESSNVLQNTKDSKQQDKLYDTVYSDKSSVLSESAERLVKEIEYILEESNEDVINLKDNSKKTKERKKETQIVYEKPGHDKCNKEKFRSVKETITINEENLLADKEDVVIPSTFPPTQRKKIATPTTSDQSPEVTESIRDLVKQKKRDFMESYKTKKQIHYDALKQQQKQQANYKYMPLKGSQPTSFKYSGHYSIPHTINRHFSPTEYAYPQSRLPPTPEDNDPQTKTSSDIIYSTAAEFNHNKAQQKHSVSTTTTAATTSSSTSMFCVSSDVSVPMGSNNSSSTPTTTHHYDDVAAAVAGVAVQTSDSILHSQPAFRPQIYPYIHPQRCVHTQRFAQPIISSTAAIQIKPAGIAYVIEFEDDKNSNENSNEPPSNLNALTTNASTTTTATNNVCAMIKTSSEPQMTLQDHLIKSKPKFLQHSKERKAILNQLQAIRQARDRRIREIVDNSSFNSLERRLQYLPPPPTQKIHILNTKEMKALTNKRCASLPEVVARKQREQVERQRHGNRVLRDIFNRRLQRRMRSGKVSLNHSKTLI